MSPAAEAPRLLRVGLVCADPLRVLGLQCVLQAMELQVPERGCMEPTVQVLSGTGALQAVRPELVIVDAAGVPFVFELLQALQRFDPSSALGCNHQP